jgi:hypothetical protein
MKPPRTTKMVEESGSRGHVSLAVTEDALLASTLHERIAVIQYWWPWKIFVSYEY